MKINNLEVLNLYMGLNIIAKEKLPIMLSFQIESIRNYLESFAKTVDRMILEIKKRHAAIDPITKEFVLAKSESGQVMPDTLVLESPEKANEEIEEFLKQELEVPDVDLRLSYFPSDFRISADNLKLIRRIIKI
jgi:hypothetical protein